MMPETPDTERLEAAALWYERSLVDPSPETLAEIARWRARDAGNEAAYQDIQRTWRFARSHSENPDLRAMRAAALGRGRRRMSAPWVAAAVVVVLIGGVVLSMRVTSQVAPRPEAERTVEHAAYNTRLGERRDVVLSDGSRLAINTDSRVRLAFTGAGRRLVIERGEAFVEVAKDPTRPFVVEAAGHTVTAHGTAFDVRLQPGALRVTLLEGEVSIQGPVAHSEPVILKPRHALLSQDGRFEVTALVATDYATSWRTGMLIFQDETLENAAREMSRYVDRPIVIADRGLAQRRVSGAFRTGATGDFLEAVKTYFPDARIEQQATRTVLSSGS